MQNKKVPVTPNYITNKHAKLGPYRLNGVCGGAANACCGQYPPFSKILTSTGKSRQCQAPS